jgi:hypothetical protein
MTERIMAMRQLQLDAKLCAEACSQLGSSTGLPPAW